MSSTHEAKVIKIASVDPHPNADRLEIVTVWGYTTCTRKGDFHPGDLAVFIEPDTLVPVKEPEFSFLAEEAKDGYTRIKAKRLRGIASFGLLVPARIGWVEGDDVWTGMGLQHYDPPIRGSFAMMTDNSSAPNVYHVKYDIESMRKFSNVIQDGDEVEITEKIHGANSRYVFHETLFCGSHTNWKREDDRNLWWIVARKYDFANKLSKYPDHVFYGEVYGAVQKFKYQATQQDPLHWACFDIMFQEHWLSVDEVHRICNELELPYVPILYRGPWAKHLENLADGPSIIPGAKNIREGCVVKPVVPKFSPEVGRVILKLVSVDYLGQKK